MKKSLTIEDLKQKIGKPVFWQNIMKYLIG